MKNPNEISSEYLGTMVYYKLTKAEQIKYRQTLTPAMIVRGWINEYQQEPDPEYRVGLNLKVFLDHDQNLHVLSAKRCKECTDECIDLESIPEGQYWYNETLIQRARWLVEYMKRHPEPSPQQPTRWQKFIIWLHEDLTYKEIKQ